MNSPGVRRPSRVTITRIVFGLLLLAAVPSNAAAVTLISRSTGLQSPEKEEGHTEYEVGDVNGDGHLDLISVGDHGSPYVNTAASVTEAARLAT
jgi:hypothetical protein